ncbi:DEAD/DEAH box helicase family protein [Streptomyces griseofuscus]|uniref:DEAD/DEAH box helicase family protein n=1 Tax=Streptomyces griseofuscus TaxID=146922 RepID=UPI00378B15CE
MISLREHQAEAVSQIRAWAGFPVRASSPAQGLRGTVISATGSGKTITAAWAALECFRGGRILVMVPTLS